jgi:hypothetical protein
MRPLKNNINYELNLIDLNTQQKKQLQVNAAAL